MCVEFGLFVSQPVPKVTRVSRRMCAAHRPETKVETGNFQRALLQSRNKSQKDLHRDGQPPPIITRIEAQAPLRV